MFKQQIKNFGNCFHSLDYLQKLSLSAINNFLQAKKVQTSLFFLLVQFLKSTIFFIIIIFLHPFITSEKFLNFFNFIIFEAKI